MKSIKSEGTGGSVTYKPRNNINSQSVRLRNEPVSKVVIYDAFPRLVPGNKGRVVVAAARIVTCVRGSERW